MLEREVITGSTVDFETNMEYFVFRDLFEYNPRIHVEFETYLPIGSGIAPFVWFSKVDRSINNILNSHSEVRKAEWIGNDGKWKLYKVTWADKELLPLLFQIMIDVNATILLIEAINKTWHVKIRFHSANAASQFQDSCLENNIIIKPARISDSPYRKRVESLLTEKQHRILRLAVEDGYYKVPQETTLEELAFKLDVEISTASECLKRAEERALEAYLRRF